MTLTPLYYRLREKTNGSYTLELMGDSLWGMLNKLQTTEAWPRFTKSSAALGDYNWDYCGSGVLDGGRDSVTMVKLGGSLVPRSERRVTQSGQGDATEITKVCSLGSLF